MFQLALSASFEYLCYDVRHFKYFNLKKIKVDPRAVKL